MSDHPWTMLPVLANVDFNDVRNGDTVTARIHEEYLPDSDTPLEVTDRVLAVSLDGHEGAVGVVTEIFQGLMLNRWYARIRLK